MKCPLSRVFLLLALGLLLASILGCERDEIRSYSARRADDSPGSGPVRLLVAIVPAGADVWFFKTVGPDKEIEALEPAFTGLIDSIRYDEKADPSLSWKVPSGWKEDRTNPNRVVTLRPEAPPLLDVAISKLNRRGYELKSNIDRWRRIDLGLGPIRGRAMPKVMKKREIGGLEVTLVDMSGPGVKKGDDARMPPGHPPTRRGKAPLTYKAPAGWQELPGRSSIVAAAFTVGEAGQTARVLVTPLSGAMPGGLVGNVNRWRDEVDLPRISEADLKKADIRNVRVAGEDSRYIDLAGRDKRSLVVWLEHKNTTWFFKMLGPRDVVEKEKTNFEAFLQSVNFSGAADE